jgi:hypothetical protein
VRCLLKRRINTHAGLPAFAHVPEAAGQPPDPPPRA